MSLCFCNNARPHFHGRFVDEDGSELSVQWPVPTHLTDPEVVYLIERVEDMQRCYKTMSRRALELEEHCAGMVLVMREGVEWVLRMELTAEAVQSWWKTPMGEQTPEELWSAGEHRFVMQHAWKTVGHLR